MTVIPQERTVKQTKDLIDSILESLKEFDPGVEDPEKDRLEAELASVVDALEPNFIGPTWQRNPDGTPYLPARNRSLGWGILAWCRKYLLHFTGPDRPIELTKEQQRFILWLYAIDENGRWIYDSGVLQRLKGWGKDPIMAVVSLVEFVGPCRFDGWDSTGLPKARSELSSWVQIAAVNQQQTKNTSLFFLKIISKQLRAEYGILPFTSSTEIIKARDGLQQLQMVTSSPRALEGGRATFVVMNETHHWIDGNQGIAMYETIDGNVTKGQGTRYLAITNAYLPGEDSVAERVREKDYNAVKDRPDFWTFRFLYDSIEAHELVPMHPVALRITIPKIRGDAVWLDAEKILVSIRKGSIANSRSRRMWLNQIVSAEDALWSEADWRMLESELYLKPGDTITLGFDGGRTDDSTALVAIRVSDLLSVPLGIWEKDGEDWVVPREAVHSAVALAFKTYNVVAFFADVNLWEHDILEWHGLYGEKLKAKAVDAGNAIGWDMRGTHNPRVTLAHERLMSAIIERKVKWSLSVNPELVGTMRRHFLNVYREENNTGVHFRKVRKDSPRKIDCYAAWVAAYEALYKYRIKGKEERPANQLWMLGR